VETGNNKSSLLESLRRAATFVPFSALREHDDDRGVDIYPPGSTRGDATRGAASRYSIAAANSTRRQSDGRLAPFSSRPNVGERRGA